MSSICPLLGSHQAQHITSPSKAKQPTGVVWVWLSAPGLGGGDFILELLSLNPLVAVLFAQTNDDLGIRYSIVGVGLRGRVVPRVPIIPPPLVPFPSTGKIGRLMCNHDGTDTKPP